ncbi:hypothetical protein TNCV_2101821 [Trichonephila clavipes]|nr:hypothetical protein TNCV_2101821 [Trichonephila clavipes]
MLTSLSSSVGSIRTEPVCTALFLWSENANQSGVKNLTSEVLTESERRTTMQENAGKVKINNKKPSKKQKKKVMSVCNLDTSDDIFDEDKNDIFVLCIKGTFIHRSASNARNAARRLQ